MLANYHTHTERCKHATGKVIDYVEAAVSAGVEILGMSDHTPFPNNSLWPEVRMAYEELDDYIKEIDEAQTKYPQIKLLKAFECEFIEDYSSFYNEVLRGQYKADYLILAGHMIHGTSPWNRLGMVKSDKEELKLYANYLVKAMETGLFKFVAHPDVFGHFYLPWDEEAIAASKYIIEAASHYNMPLEINGYGLRKPEIMTPQGSRKQYPLKGFWELAAGYDCKVLANSDAHKPTDITAKVEEGYQIADQYGLKKVEFVW